MASQLGLLLSLEGFCLEVKNIENEKGDFMNRRQGLLKMIGGVTGMTGLSGCATATSNNDSLLVLDDGITDLSPAYLANATEGSAAAFVRANFYFMAQKKRVELKKDGAIKVNDILLKRDPKEIVSYIANVPIVNDSFTFDFSRSEGQTQRHQFVVPKLQIPSYPNKYKGGGPLVIPINYEPYMDIPGIIDDGYLMIIYTPSGDFVLNVDRKDRVEMVFKPSQNFSLPPGFYRASIFRSQRFSLPKMSDSKFGWASVSNGKNFDIEITK